jgi:hypothetical protein
LKLVWDGLRSSLKNLPPENLKTKKKLLLKISRFEMQERAVPRHDYEIVDGTGTVIE